LDPRFRIGIQTKVVKAKNFFCYLHPLYNINIQNMPLKEFRLQEKPTA
jgi:hypothetical protein